MDNIHFCLTFALVSSLSVGIFYLLCLAFLPAIPVQFGRGDQSATPLWIPPILLGTSGGSGGSPAIGQIEFGGHVLWLVFVVIPMLSLSIFGRNIGRNASLRHPPVKRKEQFNREVSPFLPGRFAKAVSNAVCVFESWPTFRVNMAFFLDQAVIFRSYLTFYGYFIWGCFFNNNSNNKLY